MLSSTKGFFDIKLPVMTYVQPFSFTDQNGKKVTEDTFDGKVYVAEYFFTTCKGICPKMNANMQIVYEKYKNEKDFAILSHTSMPETDSVPVMKKYEEKILGKNPDFTAHWYFVTGSKDSLYKMARQSYLLDSDHNNYTNIEDEFIHTQFFALIDKEKRVRGVYDGLEPEEITRLNKDIQGLLDEPVEESVQTAGKQLQHQYKHFFISETDGYLIPDKDFSPGEFAKAIHSILELNQVIKGFDDEEQSTLAAGQNSFVLFSDYQNNRKIDFEYAEIYDRTNSRLIPGSSGDFGDNCKNCLKNIDEDLSDALNDFYEHEYDTGVETDMKTLKISCSNCARINKLVDIRFDFETEIKNQFIQFIDIGSDFNLDKIKYTGQLMTATSKSLRKDIRGCLRRAEVPLCL